MSDLDAATSNESRPDEIDLHHFQIGMVAGGTIVSFGWLAIVIFLIGVILL